MGQHWNKILKEGNMAFKEEKYSLASDYYRKVLAEAKKNLKQLNLLTKNNYQIVSEFCECTQLAGKAAQKEGQWEEAEAIYKDASDDLVPFISNFNNGQAYRVFTVTEFKNIFYELAGMYISNHQERKLKAHVREYQPIIVKWAKELSMFSRISSAIVLGATANGGLLIANPLIAHKAHNLENLHRRFHRRFNVSPEESKKTEKNRKKSLNM